MTDNLRDLTRLYIANHGTPIRWIAKRLSLYTLILDEVLDVISPYPVKKSDVKILKDSGCIVIDKDGFIIWDEDKKDYESRFDEIKQLALNKSLLFVNNVLLLWKYPPEIFRLFKKVYVLTYLFESSILKYSLLP